jgi:hypothetical protein
VGPVSSKTADDSSLYDILQKLNNSRRLNKIKTLDSLRLSLYQVKMAAKGPYPIYTNNIKWIITDMQMSDVGNNSLYVISVDRIWTLI